jgi:hypothetical protein
MTEHELEERLVECALVLGIETGSLCETREELIEDISRPSWGDNTGVTWESWIPLGLRMIWNDLSITHRLAAYLPAEEMRRYVQDRSRLFS